MKKNTYLLYAILLMILFFNVILTYTKNVDGDHIYDLPYAEEIDSDCNSFNNISKTDIYFDVQTNLLALDFVYALMDSKKNLLLAKQATNVVIVMTNRDTISRLNN